MSEITVQRVDGESLIVRFTNPPEGFLTPAMLPRLEEALEAAEADPQVRVIVLTGGVHGVFIQHYWDPDANLSGGDTPETAATNAPQPPLPSGLRKVCDRIERSAKPVIAAINGTCLGGGLEVALACDMRIAQMGHYSIGPTEIHLGVLPGNGGLRRLTRLIGAAPAFELVALGMTLSPDGAASRGLVNFVTPNALDASLALAKRLAARPSKALAHLKQLVNGATEAAADGNADEEKLCQELWNSAEAIARMRAFNRGEFDVRDGYPVNAHKSDAHTGVPERSTPRLRIV